MYVSADDSGVALETYLNIAFSFSRGVVRVWAAEAASARLLCALNSFQGLDQPSLEGPASVVLQQLAHIPYNSMESLVYVTNVSHLLYGATLFDTFLSETTQFLFLLLPRAMDEQPVSLRSLFDAASKSEAITQAAFARTREIGGQPFAERIQFLRQTFGLEIALTAETAEGLTRFYSVRNHSSAPDPGRFPLRIDDQGEIALKRLPRQNITRKRTALRNSAKIGCDDLRWALDSYEQAARAVARAVFTQVLKENDHPAVQLVLKGSTARLDLNAS